ncbi:MAG: hypothetical protein HC769_31415 [Cyanobacteria bacterium CRU_2_1]|nr:hypothetical protein [Cyanobacteria bacterium CRU_2_1]
MPEWSRGGISATNACAGVGSSRSSIADADAAQHHAADRHHLFSNDPVVERMDFLPGPSDRADYTFHFKAPQQWGYKLRYEGTSLVLALKHPPKGEVEE